MIIITTLFYIFTRPLGRQSLLFHHKTDKMHTFFFCESKMYTLFRDPLTQEFLFFKKKEREPNLDGQQTLLS